MLGTHLDKNDRLDSRSDDTDNSCDDSPPLKPSFNSSSLGTDFALLPIIAIPCPLRSSVWLRLEFKELGAIGLDDDQSKVLESAVDLLLLLGIVLLLAYVLPTMT
jgi:hypothetical protein